MSAYSVWHMQQICEKSSVEIQQLPLDKGEIPWSVRYPDPFRPAEVGEDPLSSLPMIPFLKILHRLDFHDCANFRQASRYLNQRIQQFPDDYPYLRISLIKLSKLNACQVYTTEKHLIEFPQHCLLNNRINRFEIYGCDVTREWLRKEMIPAFKESACSLQCLEFRDVRFRTSQDLLNEFIVATGAKKVKFCNIRNTRWALQAALYDMEWINNIESLTIKDCELPARMRPEQLARFRMTRMSFATVRDVSWASVKRLCAEWFAGSREILDFNFTLLVGYHHIPKFAKSHCVVCRPDQRRIYMHWGNEFLHVRCLRERPIRRMAVRIFRALPWNLLKTSPHHVEINPIPEEEDGYQVVQYNNEEYHIYPHQTQFIGNFPMMHLHVHDIGEPHMLNLRFH